MYHRIFTALGIAALLLSAGSTAYGAPVPVNLDFVGPGPNFVSFEATASGTITTKLFGKFIKFFSGDPNPQTDPIGLDPDTITAAFIGNPVRSPVNETGGLETAVLNFDGSNLWTPLDISDMNLNLLASPNTIGFALDQVVLEAVSTPPGFFDPDSNIKIDVGGTFQSVQFFQGANNVAFVGNTYTIPGTLRGVVDLSIAIDAFGGGITLSTGLGTQQFETPFTLTGTLTASNTSATDADLSFDGLVSGAFLLSGISTTITFDSFGAQASISLDANGSIDLSMDYHMEDHAHVPEPGTFVLLGLGAIGVLPILRRRFRKS